MRGAILGLILIRFTVSFDGSWHVTSPACAPMRAMLEAEWCHLK